MSEESRLHLIRMKAAMDLLRDKEDNLDNQIKWIEFFKSKTFFISKASLSNHFKGEENKFRNTNHYPRINKHIGDYIHITYGMKWDNANKTFRPASADAEAKQIRDITGLAGVWEGFSWHKGPERNDGTSDPLEKCAILSFKLRIYNDGQVEFASGGSVYTGTFNLITTERFYLDLTATNAIRRTFMIGNFGTVGNLSDVKMLTTAYADSGNKHVKAGLAVLLRSEEDYSKIIMESKPVSKVPPVVVKILCGVDHYRSTQLLADVFED